MAYPRSIPVVRFGALAPSPTPGVTRDTKIWM